MKFLEKQVSFKTLLVFVALLIVPVFLVACQGNQTDASNQNANTAAQKWGAAPNITNYYEYLQLKQIYELRDNPNLVMNAYIVANDGSLRCFGKVKGFGIPYGTQWSQSNGTGGSVPEPNALYPSQSTNADWVQLIDPKTGKTSVAFVEPNMIITSQDFPCKPLGA